MNRNGEIGQAYLRWLSTQRPDVPPPIWDSFLTRQPLVAGPPITEGELHDVVRWLDAHQLVDGPRAEEEDIPLRVQLTSSGRICLVDFGGDVQRWARRTGGFTDQSVHVTAHTAQVAAHAHHVKQDQRLDLVDLDRLRAAAIATRESWSLLDLPAEHRSAVEEAVQQITDETARSNPDHSKLRKAGETLKTWLPLTQSAVTVAGMIVNDVHAALGGLH